LILSQGSEIKAPPVFLQIFTREKTWSGIKSRFLLTDETWRNSSRTFGWSGHYVVKVYLNAGLIIIIIIISDLKM
jgi:hypothetical protein